MIESDQLSSLLLSRISRQTLPRSCARNFCEFNFQTARPIFGRNSAIPRRDAPEFCMISSPMKSEGVGNAGCPMHPQPRVQNGSEHTSIVTARSTGFHPAFPHAMVLTAYFVLSPATNSSCHRHRRIKVSLRPGPHGFAVRISVVRQHAVRSLTSRSPPCHHMRAQCCRVHRIPSRVRDDRDTPLLGTRQRGL
jgi:hypothetical protein